MKTVLKSILACLLVFGICYSLYFIPLIFARNRDMNAVNHLISQSDRWTNLNVRKSDNYTVIVTGSVDSQSSLNDLREKLKEAGTRRTFVAVRTNADSSHGK